MVCWSERNVDLDGTYIISNVVSCSECLCIGENERLNSCVIASDITDGWNFQWCISNKCLTKYFLPFCWLSHKTRIFLVRIKIEISPFALFCLVCESSPVHNYRELGLHLSWPWFLISGLATSKARNFQSVHQCQGFWGPSRAYNLQFFMLEPARTKKFERVDVGSKNAHLDD